MKKNKSTPQNNADLLSSYIYREVEAGDYFRLMGKALFHTKEALNTLARWETHAACTSGDKEQVAVWLKIFREVESPMGQCEDVARKALECARGERKAQKGQKVKKVKN